MRIYRDIIKAAWRTLWRTPYLWPFGLFAALAGNGGEYTTLANTVDKISAQGTLLGTLQSAVTSNRTGALLERAAANFSQSPLLTTWIVLVAVVVALLVVWVIVVSQIALIRAAGSLERNETSGFMPSLEAGVKHFWPVFLLNVLLRFATWLVLVAAVLPFLIYYLMGSASWSFSGIVLLSFIAFVPLTVVLSFVVKYAAMYVVLEGQRWWHALEKAFNLFFRNWLVSLEMALLLLVINFGLSMLLVFLLLPDVIALYSSAVAAQFNTVVALRMSLTFIISLTVGALFASFQYLAWTFLFRRLQAGSVVAKLVRLTGSLPAVPWLDGSNQVPAEPRRRK